MKRVITAAAALATMLVATVASGPAAAGPATDRMGACLVAKSSPADRVVLVRWLFSAYAANPSVKPLSAITPEMQASIEKAAADLIQRLIIEDCRQETIEAMRVDGRGSFAKAFETLGDAAATELMRDPAVAASMKAVIQHFDRSRWDAMSKELHPAKP